MKKAKLIALMLSAILILSSCSGSAGLDGNWKLTDESKSLLFSELLGSENSSLFDTYDILFLFNNGEFNITFSLDNMPDSTSRYTVNGNTFTFDDGNAYRFSVNGDELKIYGYFGVPVLTLRRLSE